MSAPTLCIHCGLSAGNPPRLNRLEDGRVCPACADRLLMSLPPVLPGSAKLEEADDESEDDLAAEASEYGPPEYDRPA
jgi:hypothetical protein